MMAMVVYDEEYDLVGNSLGRYSRGSAHKEMRFDTDGGLTLYMLAELPAKRRMTNALPISKAKFNLIRA